jgi:AraC family transcriptional regulator, positive regulator of tynA and feaB
MLAMQREHISPMDVVLRLAYVRRSAISPSLLGFFYIVCCLKDKLMNTVFSTEWVHPRDRFDFWHSVACDSFVEHRARAKSRTNFDAEIEVGSLGRLELVRFHTSPIEVCYTPAASSPTEDFLIVHQQISGALQMEHASRTLDLGPGDMMVVDPLLPHAGRFSFSQKILTIMVPRREFEARVGNARSVVGRVVKPLEPENKLASALLTTLPALAGKMNSASCDMIENHALDLIALSLAKSLSRSRPSVSDSKSVILSNIRCIIETRLSDEELNTETVAAEVGLSVRYANQVLSCHDTSIARLIQSRRLERCRLALEDPGQAHRKISEIAYGWGFSDMTHFGRRFKQAYGVPPKDYRELAKRRA